MRRSLSRAARIALLLAASALPITIQGVAAMAEVPSATPLYLEVFIDGGTTGMIAGFLQQPDGTFTIAADELAGLGLRIDPAAVRPDGQVDLALLPGVSFAYDATFQTMSFTAPLAARGERTIDAGHEAEGRTIGDPVFAAILNYALTLRYGGDGVSIGGTLTPRISGGFGTLTSGFGFRPGSDPAFIRLDTTYTRQNEERMTTLRVGDIITGGLDWTRPTRLGGFQFSRNFELRPDLVTFPVPDFGGTAAVPSTLDVYVNSVRQYSGEVPTGPFTVENLPIVTGAGTARIVLRDALGTETVTELPFFASPELLRPGFVDFSLEAGFPRLDYGGQSNAYDGRLMGSASIRWGLADRFTLEGHAEGGAGLLNGGLGFVTTIGQIGMLSASAAGSLTAAGAGYQFTGTAAFDLGRFAIQATSQRRFGAYHDIASFTAACVPAADPCETDIPLGRDSLALTVPLFDRAGLGLSFTNVLNAGADPDRLLGLSLSARIGDRASISLSGFADAANWDSFGIAAGFSMPLGGRMRSSVEAESRGTGVEIATVIAGGAPDGPLSWSLRDVEGASPSRYGELTFDAGHAQLNAGLGWNAGGLYGQAGVSGAVVAAGGGIFLANRIDNGFTVVDVGVPGVEVFYENRPAGTTNAAGRLLLTEVRPYEINRITIDPAGLPLEAAANETTMFVVPGQGGGTVAQFAVDDGQAAALVVLRDPEGGFVPVGSVIALGAESTVVGYDGMAYLTGLSASNRISVIRADGRQCEASFAFAPRPGAQVTLDAVCVPVAA